MAPTSPAPRRTPTGRRRGRPPGTTNAAMRAARQASLSASAASEPPPKRRRYVPGGPKYIPGGPGGGGRFLDPEDLDTLDSSVTASRSRTVAVRDAIKDASPSLGPPKRARSARTRAQATDDEILGSAAAVAASIRQAEDYKPREERSWEEFHPLLDTEKKLMVFLAEEVDGLPVVQEAAPTLAVEMPGTPSIGSMTPSKKISASTGNTPNPLEKIEMNPSDKMNGTPSRRSRRPTRDVVSFYGTRPLDFAISATPNPKTPKVLPIQNQTAKERLDLKLPSYRNTNRIELFESKTFGQARYVDKAMSNVGYQESDHFIRPERQLIKTTDMNIDDDIDQASIVTADDAHHTRFSRVEYDMDEQDDMWLEDLNARRKGSELEAITREIFEITMTKIEKEWHSLEKRIPKPNPKPPQTHRPRSSSAAAVNGEPHVQEEPDTKCAICDDGDCENTNAIVFCDGCDLAVHQECYGVPFIPEGQWLCRKCQLCGRGVPTCVFCPNTEGAFKQTNGSKWSHLLCAMWVPEVSLGNHTFMEPVMDVEKVPKTRWKLNCYICNQKMGACIQCGNKNCYQAFHVTCARRARLYLKMKTQTGALAVLDGSMVLKAFCDKHCPADYTEEHGVEKATKAAKKFYRRNMKGRIWADNHATAAAMAAQQRDATLDAVTEENQLTGVKNTAAMDKKKGQHKNVWRLPSGAPVIPQAVFDTVEASLQRFPFRKRKDFLSEACRYWTLKREARRGAALLKRLQLQMDSFTSMELTRRNFASMGPDGKDRLARRIQFVENLVQDLEQLKTLTDDIVEREQLKVNAAELEQEFVDECYFPVAKLLAPAIEKAITLDKDLFNSGLLALQRRIEERHYARVLAFAQDLGDVIHKGIVTPHSEHHDSLGEIPPPKPAFSDIRERRKLGKRILKALQPQLETALRVESEITNKPFETLQKELETKIEASLEGEQLAAVQDGKENENHDSIVVDVTIPGEISVKAGTVVDAAEDAMDTAVDGAEIEVKTGLGIVNGDTSEDIEMTDEGDVKGTLPNGVHQTPPGSTASNRSPRLEPHNGDSPPTPPQSNGSLGTEPCDTLADGGVLWYLKAYELEGTSILGDHYSGRDAVRMLSEDLTDLDDEELQGLGADVEETAIAAAVEAEEDKATEVAVSHVKTRAGKAAPKKRRTSARRR